MIGDLKHRVTIEAPARTGDGGGGFAEDWQPLDDTPDVYAAIEQLSGSERLSLSQLGAVVTHRVKIRYRDDVTAKMRLVKGTAVYKIISVTDVSGAQRDLELLAALQ